MSEVKYLLQKLRDIRVLRSSCSESYEGEFRVHLPEKEWDEIQELVRMCEKECNELNQRISASLSLHVQNQS